MMKGTICFATDEEESWLRRIGVKLGPVEDGGWHTCEMSDAVFEKLEPRWGTFFWALEPSGDSGGADR